MNIQSSLIAHDTPVPIDHIEPDFYIDPNYCTLHNAVQQLAIDGQADIPFMVWLLEAFNSPLALPGKISLYGHDCLHAILNRGHSLSDEAFVKGFTMGNDTRTNWLHRFLYQLISSTVYPKKYRFSCKDFQSFNAGFTYGRAIQAKDLNQTDFRTYQSFSVSRVRQQLGIARSNKTASIFQVS